MSFYNDNLIQNTNENPDHVIFGIPLDLTCIHQSGAKEGPDAIRKGLREYYEYHYKYRVDPYKKFKFIDFGNISLSSEVIESLNRIETEIKKGLQKYPKAKIIVLGGEHLVTYPVIKTLDKKITLIVFDAHFDLLDEFNGSKYNHATYLRRIFEETSCKDIIHIGVRDCDKEELKFADKNIIYFNIDTDINKIKEVLKAIKSEYYVSFDVDIFDPSVVCGTGIPVPGGIFYRDLINIIESLPKDKNIGFDLVELAPKIDPTKRSELTISKLLHDILSFYAQR